MVWRIARHHAVEQANPGSRSAGCGVAGCRRASGSPRTPLAIRVKVGYRKATMSYDGKPLEPEPASCPSGTNGTCRAFAAEGTQ